MGKGKRSGRAIRNPETPGSAGTKPVRTKRFLALFSISAVLAFGVLFAPFAQPAVASYSSGLVRASGELISIAGGKARVEGAVLSAPSGNFAIEMKNGCNGVNVMILLWCAILAFPSSWIWKAGGLVVGSAAIQSVNFVRFISLFYLGQYNMTWFEFAHSYLWESLIMVDALVVFWVWATMTFRSAATRDAVR